MATIALPVPTRTRIPHGALVAGLFVLATVLRPLRFQGFADFDPSWYAALASDLARGQLQIPGYQGFPAHALRIGFYGPMAALIRIFGLSELSMVAYPFLASLGECGLAYLLGRLLFGRVAGLLALAIMALVPLNVVCATALYADLVGAFWADLGLTLVILGMVCRTVPFAVYPAAGIALGVSWLCKENVCFLLPLAGVLALRGRSWRAAAAVAGGCVAVFLGECGFYAMQTGDVLYRFHEMERHYQVCAFDFPQEHILTRLFDTGPRMFLLTPGLALLPLLSLAAAATSMGRGLPLRWIPAGWLLWEMVLFNFASCSLHRYLPLPLMSRFLCPLMLPAAVLLAGAIAHGLQHRARPVVRFALVVVCLAFTTMAVREISNCGLPSAMQRAVARQLAPTDILYTDPYTVNIVGFFRTGTLIDPGTRDWRELPPVPREAYYVLVNPPMVRLLIRTFGYAPPACAGAIPPTWRSVWSGYEAQLFRVEPEEGTVCRSN